MCACACAVGTVVEQDVGAEVARTECRRTAERESIVCSCTYTRTTDVQVVVPDVGHIGGNRSCLRYTRHGIVACNGSTCRGYTHTNHVVHHINPAAVDLHADCIAGSRGNEVDAVHQVLRNRRLDGARK